MARGTRSGAATTRREALEGLRTSQLRSMATKLGLPTNVRRQDLIDHILKHEARAARTTAVKTNRTLVVKGRVRRGGARRGGANSAFDGAKLERVLSAVGRGKKTGRVDLSCPAGPDGDLERLEAFPTELIHAFKQRRGRLRGLQQLWLTNQSLGSLPMDVRMLRNLRVLAIGGNGLSSLPASLGELVLLERLYAERNELNAVPPSITSLERLTELSLSRNQFTEIPDGVTQLRNLRRLDLSHNHIGAVPHAIRRLNNLVELDLDWNRVGPSLPASLRYLARTLSVLGLASNCLASEPDVLLDLPNLVTLRLAGNRSAEYEVIDEVTGVEIQDRAVPVRHDGYLQLRQGAESVDDAGNITLLKAGPLPGIVDSKLSNALTSLWAKDVEPEPLAILKASHLRALASS